MSIAASCVQCGAADPTWNRVPCCCGHDSICHLLDWASNGLSEQQLLPVVSPSCLSRPDYSWYRRLSPHEPCGAMHDSPDEQPRPHSENSAKNEPARTGISLLVKRLHVSSPPSGKSILVCVEKDCMAFLVLESVMICCCPIHDPFVDVDTASICHAHAPMGVATPLIAGPFPCLAVTLITCTIHPDGVWCKGSRRRAALSIM